MGSSPASSVFILCVYLVIYFCLIMYIYIFFFLLNKKGGVAEWFKASVLKIEKNFYSSWVRIPSPSKNKKDMGV